MPRETKAKGYCEHCAFCTGWRDANEGTVWDPTPGEVEAVYPSWSYKMVREYLNGADDGMRGDRYRLDLHRQPTAGHSGPCNTR